MSAMGPNALLMLALFLPAALHAPCLPRTGRVFSLSCVPWRQARVESCSKMLLPSKGEKRESHLVVPVGDFRAASPPRSFSPAPFHGWLKAGQRTPLRWSEVRARLRRCEEGFSSPLQTPGDVTEPRGRCQLRRWKRRLTEYWFGARVRSSWDKWGLLAAAGFRPPLRPKDKKSVAECLQMPGGMGSASGTKWREPGYSQEAQNNAFTCTFAEQAQISSQM